MDQSTYAWWLSVFTWSTIVAWGLVGVTWIRKQTARSRLSFALCIGCTLCLVRLAVGLWHFPVTAFSPLGFSAICLPAYGASCCFLCIWLRPRWRIAIASLIVTIGGMSWVGFQLRDRAGRNADTITEQTGDQVHAYLPRLGYYPKPKARGRYKQLSAGKSVLDFQFEHDCFGRRLTPDAPMANQFILAFGCSFTYGWGVSTHETWPYQLGQFRRECQVYNYACGGWGPSQMLDILETRKLRAEVLPIKGQAVFLFLPGHPRRVIGSWQVVHGWGGRLSRYKLKQNHPVYLGSLGETQNPMEFMACHTLGRLGLLRHVEVPRTLSLLDSELTASIISESQELLNRQFGACPLTVVFWSSKQTAPQEIRQVEAFLRARKIRTIHLGDLVSLDTIPIIAGDGHPNEAGHAKMATALSSALRAGATPK